jgi:hypothetical protein
MKLGYAVMRNITYTMTLLTLLLLALNTATANAQGGSIQAPRVTLHSVCGDSSQGLLYAVGNDTKNGLIYRITKLTSNGYELFVNQSPQIHGRDYVRLRFYACKVVDDYLFVVGETLKNDWDGSIIVYSISKGTSVAEKSYNIRRVSVRFIDVEVSKVGNTYYIYALLITTGKKNNIRIAYASFSGTSLGTISNVAIGTGSGYEITLYGNYLGVLWKSGSNLYLSVYSVSSGSPASGQTVTIVTSFTGARAAEAAYSDGFLVAASGTIYRVYLDGTTWNSKTLVNNVFSGDAYAMLVAEENGAKAAYVFTQVNTAISISAIDLVNNRIAYTSSVANVGQAMEGYGDATVAWVDPNNNNVVSSTTPNARPYMVYTVTSSAPSSYVIYYDLSRGGTTPYPVPEPWLTNIVVIIVSIISTTIILKKS